MMHVGDTMIAVGGNSRNSGGWAGGWGATVSAVGENQYIGEIPRLLWGGIMSAVADIQYGGGIL